MYLIILIFTNLNKIVTQSVIVCILFQNFSQTIDVDSNATNTGICDSSKSSETLEIHFNNDWKLTFIFSNYKDRHTNVTYFYTDQINFAYKLDSDYFPHLGKYTPLTT